MAMKYEEDHTLEEKKGGFSMNLQTRAIPFDAREFVNAIYGSPGHSEYSAFVNETDMRRTTYDEDPSSGDRKKYKSFGKLLRIDED